MSVKQTDEEIVNENDYDHVWKNGLLSKNDRVTHSNPALERGFVDDGRHPFDLSHVYPAKLAKPLPLSDRPIFLLASVPSSLSCVLSSPDALHEFRPCV